MIDANDQPLHTHTPLTDPTNGKEETIGGLFDGLRARVCAVCGMLYVPHELMHAWRDHRVTVASKADAQRASSGPLVVALRRRALQEADAAHEDDDDEVDDDAACSLPLNHRSASAIPDGSADRLAGVMVYGKVGSDHHVRLWDAINAFAVASGGSADAVNPARMNAVARIESLLQFPPSNPNREKTTP